MRNRIFLQLALVAAVAPASLAAAGEFNPTLNIGDPAPAWSKLPGVDGKNYSLDDFKEKDVLVVAFTCNSCPYAVDYEDRLIAFSKAHCGEGKKVALIAVNVNKVEEDLPDQMKARAKEKGFNFPYLFDESQKIAKDFGATFTPEFFIIGKDRKIVYMGSMDDSTEADKVKTKYVEAAVAAALKGEVPATKETAAKGCLVRYAKERRKKP